MHLVDITMFYAAEGGGVSTYLNAKGRWLARRRCMRHSILSPNVVSGGQAPALAALSGMALPGLNGFRLPLSVAGPAHRLAGLHPDLIEAGDAGPCAWAALRAGRSLGVPTVAFYHSDLPRLVVNRFGAAAGAATRLYLARLYRRFDMVLAPSRLMVQQLADMGVDGVLHQPLGIDSSVFHPRRRLSNLRARLRLAPDTRLLVYAGRFTPDKKLPLLIEAVRRLGWPYHLLLIGGGQVLPRHAQLSYLPFQRDQRQLARLLASCDVLVHPGDCETFGLIVLEAMACGLPVVATRGGGVAELVDDSTGILVRPGSASALSAGIDALYRRCPAHLGQTAVRKARTQYDWERVLPQLMARYAGLLASRPRAELEADGNCVAD